MPCGKFFAAPEELLVKVKIRLIADGKKKNQQEQMEH